MQLSLTSQTNSYHQLPNGDGNGSGNTSSGREVGGLGLGVRGGAEFPVLPLTMNDFFPARPSARQRAANFCELHLVKFIFVGLSGLFLFNMALYSYIFYLAHAEGHDF